MGSDRHIHQQNIIEDRNKPMYIWETTFQQRCKGHSAEKGQYSFQQMVLAQLDIHMNIDINVEKMNVDLHLALYSEINSKWIIDLTIKT